MIKAMPVVEPHRLPHLAGLMATQLYVLKIALPPQRPCQRLPKGSLQEILRLHKTRGIIKLICDIPALYGFCNGFLDAHNSLPPSQGVVLMVPVNVHRSYLYSSRKKCSIKSGTFQISVDSFQETFGGSRMLIRK